MHFKEQVKGKKIEGLTILSKILLSVAGFILGLLITRIFLFMPYLVQDSSMLPGLNKGDYVIVLKISDPDPGDIVLVNSPAEPDAVILKRLIAKGPGYIEITGRNFYINRKSVSFRWKTLSKDTRRFPSGFSGRDNLPERELKEGEMFIIGDNLNYSFDSRDFGPVSEENIIGRIIFQF